MLVNAGRVLMICVWGFMIFNLIQPFPKPFKYFMDIAMIFMIVMHALQTVLLKATLAKGEKLSGWLQTRIFFFGVFEMLAMQKKQNKRLRIIRKNN